MAIPPSALKDLVKLPVAAEWRQLGVQLGVPLHRLRRIQANNRNCPDFAQECLTDMFYWWLNNGRDVTYERLGCGLRGIGETNLATQLCEQHLNGQQTHLHIQRELNVHVRSFLSLIFGHSRIRF